MASSRLNILRVVVQGPSAPSLSIRIATERTRFDRRKQCRCSISSSEVPCAWPQFRPPAHTMRPSFLKRNLASLRWCSERRLLGSRDQHHNTVHAYIHHCTAFFRTHCPTADNLDKFRTERRANRHGHACPNAPAARSTPIWPHMGWSNDQTPAVRAIITDNFRLVPYADLEMLVCVCVLRGQSDVLAAGDRNTASTRWDHRQKII